MDVYQPLSREGREFRLVRITPGQQDSPIELTLDHASLDNAPSYAALSYVWGEEKVVDVRVNGITTSIRENLHRVLVQIRDGGLESSTSLWIDAICINQSDDTERSWQVNEMRTIFSQASLVYNWLGPQADDSDVAMKLLNSIGERVLEAGHDDAQWAAITQRLRYYVRSSMGAPGEEDPDYAFLLRLWRSPGMESNQSSNALAALLHREYFSRVWIIQEVALAKRGVVLCGNMRLPLATFDAALKGIYLCVTCEKLVVSSLKTRHWLMPDMVYFDLKPFEVRQAISSGSPLPLWEILMAFHGVPSRPVYLASDPRDIVFGVLGCAEDTATLNIQADYTQTIVQVFAKLTKALLDHCPDYPLAYSVFPKSIPGLPSWVPDWKLRGESGFRVYPIGRGTIFKPARDLTQPLGRTLCSNWKVLRRQGYHVNTVMAVMEAPEIYTDVLMTLKEERVWLEKRLEKILQFWQLGTPSGHIGDAVWCTIMKGQFPQARRLTPEWFSITPKLFRGERLNLKDLTAEQTNYIKSCIPDLNLYSFFGLCSHWAMICSRGMTLFKTKSGSVGLGPERMAMDDILVILWGCDAPIILRPLANHQYSYIGEAYVHGIMDGEFLDTNPTTETFDIV